MTRRTDCPHLNEIGLEEDSGARKQEEAAAGGRLLDVAVGGKMRPMQERSTSGEVSST